MRMPTPHGDKLRALMSNEKLPAADRPRIEKALRRYESWLADIASVEPDNAAMMTRAVAALHEYRKYLDLEVIFDSPEDFLYRQKGQLKLDNSVIEEFLPHVAAKRFPELGECFALGPCPCFSALYFTSTLATARGGPNAHSRTKDQDFAVSKTLYLKASFDVAFGAGAEELAANIGYLCAECKTNLDKTMFQEASATARDVKTAVPGAKYLLLCEWLDMAPISTAGTGIDEVLVLRKAKRIGSQVRSQFASKQGRKAARPEYARFLGEHPFSPDVFERVMTHIRGLVEDRDPVEADVLSRGYF